uniref:Uncharacterized protein n=1 Tax=Cannabis sativa TaxID=3483 RepID=A0A803RCP6_CANSA
MSWRKSTWICQCSRNCRVGSANYARMRLSRQHPNRFSNGGQSGSVEKNSETVWLDWIKTILFI